MLRIGLAFACLASGSLAIAQSEFGFDNRKGSGQPYLKADETVAKFKVPKEFDIKLFAGEPDCVNPIAFTIDERGRIWVVECFEYPSKTPKGKAPRDRIVILEDTDGDGKSDKRTIFAEGKDFPVPEARKKEGKGAFDLASGIEVGHGKVFIGAPPYLWSIEIGKDDKPGKFETLLSGFGSEDTHETLNTFQWGPDGWLYGLHGVFTQSNVKSLDGPETRMNAAVWRYHPTSKKFEIFAEGTSNPWGMDWRNSDGQFILACCVIPHLYHIVPGGIYKRQAGASYNPYAYGEIKEISDHTFHKESGWAHAGLISLDAPHIPERFRNSVIFGSIHGCSIKQNILKPNGSSYTASRGDDFLSSGDKNFRPINMKWGPHGDIYLIDWHDQNPCHQAKASDWDYERGRVYRIQLKDRKGGKPEDLGKVSDSELAKLAVTSDDPYLGRTATRLLAAKPKAEIKKGLKDSGIELVNNVRMLRLVHANGDYNAGSVTASPKINLPEFANLTVQATRMADGKVLNDEQFAGMIEVATMAELPVVRRELASLAIKLTGEKDTSKLLHALVKHKDDASDPLIPQLVWIAYEKALSKLLVDKSKLTDELAFLAKEAPDNIFVRDAIVPKVMRRLVASGKPENLALIVKFVADVKDVNTREKALDGLTIALAGQTLDAPVGWKELDAELRKEKRLTNFANMLAVTFRDPEAIRRAVKTLALTGESEVRVQALREIVQLKTPGAAKIVGTLLREEKDDKVRLEAARQVAALADSKFGSAIVADWKTFPKDVQGELVASLASRKETARLLLKAMEAKTVERTAITDNTIAKIQSFGDKDLNALIEKAWGRTRKTPDELNKLIDKTRDSLGKAPASFAAGKKIFEAQCAKCHKFDGAGNEVGPQLDGAGRDIEYLLANVLDPNRVIGAPYFVRTANLLDGQAIQGILAEEDDKFITMKVEGARLVKLAKADIDGPVKVAEKSLMPEGLSYGMSEQDFRDLVKYVMANPYLTGVTVDGKSATVGVPGLIPLSTGAEVVISAEFAAAKAFETKLIVAAGSPFKVLLDGKELASGQGNKDGESFDAKLSEGKHALKLIVDQKAGSKKFLSVRFLDPDRRLSEIEAK